MSPALMKEAVEITNGKALLEASGGITDETLREMPKQALTLFQWVRLPTL